MDEQVAAVKIQALKRGNSARGEYKDIRDEEARRQWVEYYVQTGDYAEARELGWDGDTDEPGTLDTALLKPSRLMPVESGVTTGPIAVTNDDERVKAARMMQAHARGSSARIQYRDKRDDEARSQWIAYYLALGDLESARELGWDEADKEQAQAATALAAARRGQLTRRSLGAGVAIPGGMPFPDLPKPSAPEDEAAPATPERLGPSPTAADREAFASAEREAFGGKTENEMALETAQAGAPIFSSRWFGKVWDGMISPDKKGQGGEEGGEESSEKGGEEARRVEKMQEKAAIIVQCWCRVVLAKVAVKNEGRKYRLLALYAHVEEKNATVIQVAFRNRQSFTGAGEIDEMATRRAQLQPVHDVPKEEAVLCHVSITLARDHHHHPSSHKLVLVSVTPALSHAEAAAKISAELVAELVANCVGLCADAQVEVASASSALPEGMPPSGDGQPTNSTLQGALLRAGGPELERKIAEIKANHAATVMQKLHRDAGKKEVCKRLRGVLYKRSQGMPVFRRRSAYISTDGHALVYCNYKEAASNTRAEKRIPLASITAIALESELFLEFSVDSTIRGKKFLFRCSERSELQMWLNGLADLTP